MAISQPNKHKARLMNTRTSTAQAPERNPFLILTLFGSAKWWNGHTDIYNGEEQSETLGVVVTTAAT
jgi:hypothetical protein